MDNVFNIARFGRLFVKHTAEHYKSYLMSLTVLIGVMVLGGSFIIFVIPGGFLDLQIQSSMYVVILLLAGTIFTSTIFTDYGNKNKAIALLTLPASHFEKYLVAWLYSFILFIIVFTCSFYLILLLLTTFGHFPGRTTVFFNVFGPRVGFQILLLFSLLHAIAFFGAIVFEKLHFIKSAFAFFISGGVLIFLNKIILGILLGIAVMPSPPFSNVRFTENGKMVDINVARIEESHVIIPMIVLTLVFWIAAYYRLKEKQV